ncbi:hypothetical protein FGO68_gene11713 [Halteria grandinella]|uniref:Uncharacterized protein n=1 Tax=Halteria grandinella TaxID=5974 RepID=A0A8J8SUS1_HALGN|nr:hypothetical protein FGO68_gene11713 [Halteria grandinella]
MVLFIQNNHYNQKYFFVNTQQILQCQPSENLTQNNNQYQLLVTELYYVNDLQGFFNIINDNSIKLPQQRGFRIYQLYI